MKKILIVEDEQEIRELLRKKLEKHGYDAVAASNGREALYTCSIVHPDIILLDVAMPQMDGYQFCEKLKQNAETKDISILFLTGKDLELKGIIERCKALGTCGFISKLSPFEELLAKIKEIIG